MMHERSIKLTIDSKIDDIELLSKSVRAICNTVINEEILLYNLELCLVEAVSNVINHGYHRKSGNAIEVIVTVDDRHVTFNILDSGDKLTELAPKKELMHSVKDLSSLPESGMGLFLINKIMDEISYCEQQNKNSMIMTKYFDVQVSI